MDHEEYLSDASLIEDDEEEIDLPDDITKSSPMEHIEDEGEQEELSDAEFYGFEDHEIPPRNGKDEVDIEMDEMDLTAPFPADMKNCIRWYPRTLPAYDVKFATEPVLADLPTQTPTLSAEEDHKKIKPLKIKKTNLGNFSTPSPFLQRESREWKPSSQFFKPLNQGWVREVIYDRNEDGSLCSKAKEVIYHAPVSSGSKKGSFKSPFELKTHLTSFPSLTLHNFSFRNDPLNAPRGQEVIRAVDEQVEIFPPTPELVKPPPAKATSLNPALSGLLKVKMFGKMKEKNAYDAHGGSSEKSDSNMEIDDEDFDLESPQAGKTQSLGNSGVTITPISHLNKERRKDFGSNLNVHMPTSSLELTKKVRTLPLANKKKPILRPPVASHVTCSIHCMNASGYPQLNCVSCQSLYHPACVGLNSSSDYMGYDFYCSTCQPPSGKENKPFTLGNSSTTITSAHGSHSSSKTKSTPSVTLTPTGSTGSTTKKRTSLGKTAMPLRPIEAQSVVNIAGMKYLVVPHSDPGALKAKKSDGTSKLPFILKPTSEECPTFEVEELPDGKLTIIPIGPKAAKAKNLIAKKTQPMDFAQFQNSLSAGYFAMLHVFRYLNTNDRIKASRVCKLWYQISKDQSLWQNVAVKDCRVRSWTVLRDQCNRNCTKRLDLKKMPLETDDNTLWSGFNGNFINAVTTLTSLELPKISAPSLHSVVQTAIDSPITQLKAINASNVTATDDTTEPINLLLMAELENLEELRLKSLTGNLVIDNFTQSLCEFAQLKSASLTKLALVSIKSLEMEHLSSVTQFQLLDHLELGNCDKFEPQDLFESITQLPLLKYLRLECGRFNEHLSNLGELEYLRELELINFEMEPGFGQGLTSLQNIQKLLLIPDYSEEVANINAEAMDSFLSLKNLTHFFFGLKTEWLELMNDLLTRKDSSLSPKDSFPIVVNGHVEMYTLSKLYKTLLTAMPDAHKVKILKMPKTATRKQYISTQK